jgi:hypothetical protein
LLHGGRRPRAARTQQLLQHRLDPGLALTRRQVQDPQVLLDRTLGVLLDQPVVGQAKAAGREQLLAVAIAGERPRLAHQPVDDVPVGDAVLAPATQTRQALDQALGVPDLDVVGEQAGLDPFPNQPAGHRVGVAADVDGAAAIHTHLQTLAGIQALAGQRPQQGQLLDQPRLPAAIALDEQLSQERLIRRPTGEVPAATQHQRLVQRPLELPVALLHVAVLVRLRRVDRLTLQAIVFQQRLVTPLERGPITAGRDGGRQGIGAMHLGNAPQLGQGVLQAVAEALEALGEADRAGLPVGVGQHEVVDQVHKRLAVDGHLQTAGVRKVGGAQLAGLMDLAKEDLLGRPVQGTPLLDVSLQGAQLPIGKAAGIFALQPVKHGLGLQAGVESQLLLDACPDLGEGVESRSPGMLHAHLAGQPAEPAVLARGLVVEASLGGGLAFGQSLLVQAAKTADLQVGNHPKPPCGKGFG